MCIWTIDSLRSPVALHEWLAFYSAFFEYPPKWCTYSTGMAGATWTAAVSTQVLCTPYNHAPCDFMQSHICKVYACLAVICHLHFWQNDQDFLCAAVVTWGWNEYQNESAQKVNPGEKKLSHCSSKDLKPQPFSHKSSAQTTELSPPPVAGRLKLGVLRTCTMLGKVTWKQQTIMFVLLEIFAKKGCKSQHVIRYYNIHSSLCLHFYTSLHKIKSHY